MGPRDRSDLMATVDSIVHPPQAGAVATARSSPFRLSSALAQGTSAGVLQAVLGSKLDAEPSDRRSEASVIKAAQNGSERALETLFRRHWRGAHRAAYLIVQDAQAAEDIAQEAFLTAIRALDRFDRRRSFRPWLHRIVVNRAIDHTRARKLRREVRDEAAAADSMVEDTPQLGDDVLSALADLSPEHRAVIVLRYLLDYTPGEIGRMLDLPRGTVNSRIRRGLDRLSTELGGGHR